jgi:hypothetical protein
MMGMWFILLVQFLVMMVVLGIRNIGDEEEELEIGNGTYYEEEEEMDEDDDFETDSDVGVKTCDQVLMKDRNRYGKEEEATQNKSKKSRVEFETSGSHRMSGGRSLSPHIRGFTLMHLGRKTIQISLTNVGAAFFFFF